MSMARMPNTPEGALYADRLEPGMMIPLGSWEVTADQILEFGRQWDPLPFHIDEQLAAETSVGGLIASGVHTVAIAQRLTVEAVWNRFAAVIGRGLNHVRWPEPVRPGDTLTGAFQIEEVRSRGGQRAILAYRTTLHNQRGVIVCDARGETVIPSGPAPRS